jgi:hypothetical protein
MEELLNKLIEKGWKPRDEESVKSCMVWEPFYKRKFIEKDLWFYIDDRWTPQWLFTKSLREICSKWSWLWQFVCENGMVKHDQYTNTIRQQIYEDERDSETYATKYDEWSYLFRIIQSALCDEDKLEEFLLQNIKVEW